MNQSHTEALENPNRVQQGREGKLTMFTDNLTGRRDETHDHQTDKGNSEARGDGPFAADTVGNTAGNAETDNRGKTAENCQDHGGAGNRLQMIDDIVSYIGA